MIVFFTLPAQMALAPTFSSNGFTFLPYRLYASSPDSSPIPDKNGVMP